MIIRRAALIVVSAFGLVAEPFTVEAQLADKVHRIGYLATNPVPQEFIRGPFVQAMRELGYIEGQNLVIETRSANNRPERLPVLAAELVRLKVDIIVTGGDGEVRAARQATMTIPIVMAPGGDPVRAGFVASLSRPGGNVTGLSWVSPELSAKLLELLKGAVPNVSRVAILWNSANPTKVIDFDETRRAAQALGLAVSSIEVKTANNLESAFGGIKRARPDALVVLVDEVLSPATFAGIAEFAIRQRLPSILGQPAYAATGGLIAYGPTVREVYQRAATFVDKLLKGAKPAELPVEQPTKFVLAINLQTAKALGLTIPPSLLLRADEVIQ
jgi:putative tryptophan/tyrosine transport system substrate-binding protein